jgi:hypothetical protein
VIEVVGVDGDGAQMRESFENYHKLSSCAKASATRSTPHLQR